MILEAIQVGSMQVNCYVIASGDNGNAILIDPGDDAGKIKKVLNKHRLKLAFIINTHGHIDHIGCDDMFGVGVYIHSLDAPLLKDPELNLSSFLAVAFKVKSELKLLEDKQIITLDDIQLEVLHIPGHTPGGIALFVKNPQQKILFTGDSLFAGSIGRTDFPGASEELLIASIKKKLLTLSNDTVIYPGHGPSSTIGEEKINNPFLAPD